MPPTSRFVRYAPKNAKYLVVSPSDHLPESRRLLVTAPLTTSDEGGSDDFTIGVADASASLKGVLQLAGQLGGSASAPDVRGVRVNPSGTPVLLTLGAVADGEVLARSGTGLVGVSVLSSGGGALTGDLAMGGNKVTGLASGVDSGDAATYGQLTSMLNGLDWQKSVIDNTVADPTTISPSTGERYLVAPGGTGAWSGKDGQIAQKETSGWSFIVPNDGFTVHVDEDGSDYYYDGTAWVNIGASVDHASLLNLATGNPHTQYQLASGREASGGYAGLDTDLLPIRPTRGVRVGSDPGTTAPGEVWVVGADLKFKSNAGTPAIELVERLARRNQNDGYAGLDGNGRVEANQAPAKAVYTGGAQAIAPADIGAVATSRSVASGVGLSGGGALSADRTLSVAAFVGVLSKDVDPASQDYAASTSVVHATYDIGTEGAWLPTGLRLPPRGHASLVSEAVFEFQDATSRVISNVTDSTLDDTFQGLANFIAGDVTMAADSNGQAIRKIILRTRNATGGGVTGVDVGVFRIRALGLPRGGGAAL